MTRGGGASHHAMHGGLLHEAAGAQVWFQNLVHDPGIQLHEAGMTASPGQGLQPNGPRPSKQVQPGTVRGQIEVGGPLTPRQQHVEHCLAHHLHHRPGRVRIPRQQAPPCIHKGSNTHEAGQQTAPSQPESRQHQSLYLPSPRSAIDCVRKHLPEPANPDLPRAIIRVRRPFP